VHYFETNAHRMHHAWYRKPGMFAGSWTEHGVTGILTLRCHEASNRWDQIWQWPHNQTPAA
jgi:hypothetical protein